MPALSHGGSAEISSALGVLRFGRVKRACSWRWRSVTHPKIFWSEPRRAWCYLFPVATAIRLDAGCGMSDLSGDYGRMSQALAGMRRGLSGAVVCSLTFSCLAQTPPAPNVPPPAPPTQTAPAQPIPAAPSPGTPALAKPPLPPSPETWTS